MAKRGPKTPEGKGKVSRNALKHGFTARKHVLLDGEDPAAFETFRASVVKRLQPTDAYETMLANRIALSRWRSDRAVAAETALIDDAITAAGDVDPGLVAAFQDPELDRLHRYEAAMERRHSRDLADLHARQASRLFGAPVRPGSYSILLPYRLLRSRFSESRGGSLTHPTPVPILGEPNPRPKGISYGLSRPPRLRRR